MGGGKRTSKSKVPPKKTKESSSMLAGFTPKPTAIVDDPDLLDTTEARQSKIVDARRAQATTTFTAAAMGLSGTKKCPTSSGMKTIFAGEATHDVQRRIKQAELPLQPAEEVLAAEAATDVFAAFDDFATQADMMPRRPTWTYGESSGRVHHREAQHFQAWLARVKDRLIEKGGYAPAFEQNLQVWRQLWRVTERADVVVLVVDVRHPLLHLPPALYTYVSAILRKPLVVVLNKVDAVPLQLAASWARAIRAALPGVSAVIGFSSKQAMEGAAPPAEESSGETQGEGSLLLGRAALIDTCHRAFASSGGSLKRGAEAAAPGGGAGAGPDPRGARGRGASDEEEDDDVDEDAACSQGRREPRVAGPRRLILGLIGHPNVGKSSLLNSIYGAKVVSVKNTPGHTKTLQTMILDPRTALLDSPGVVFPRLEVPLEVQIIGGLVPIAQVREAFTPIRWLAAHCPGSLPGLLNLHPPLPAARPASGKSRKGGKGGKAKAAASLDDELGLGLDLLALAPEALLPPEEEAWSPLSICRELAVARGFVRNKQPDLVQSSHTILKKVLDGALPYLVQPPAAPPRARPTPEAASLKLDDSAVVLEEGEYESEEEDEEAVHRLVLSKKDQEMMEQYGKYDSDDEGGQAFMS